MLKCTSIHTYEIDDRETALNEIQAQISEKISFSENTIGIVMCHTEFIMSGMMQHICENMPFKTVGVTTTTQAVNGEAGELILTIFVMTSDDIRFVPGITKSLENGFENEIKEACENASKDENDEPGLALIFPPFIVSHTGDDYIKSWHNCIPNTPLFGTFSIDDTPNFAESETIFNGISSKTAMPFVLCYGNINPRFIIGTIPKGNNLPYRGEVTKSTGPFVHEINNIAAYRYFESIGFESDSISSVNYLLLPFSIDQKARVDYDGIPVIRVLDTFTEDGSAIFHGNVDEGSIFTLQNCESADVISVTQQIIEQINETEDINGVLIFSCVLRRIATMKDNHNEEFYDVRDTLRPDIPFMMGCAGGEICPTFIKDGVPTNRYHNFSIVTLIV